jgi:hypothetical protein
MVSLKLQISTERQPKLVQAQYKSVIKSKVRLALGLWCITFKNISIISWRSVLLFAETGVPGENQRPVVSH